MLRRLEACCPVDLGAWQGQHKSLVVMLTVTPLRCEGWGGGQGLGAAGEHASCTQPTDAETQEGSLR